MRPGLPRPPEAFDLAEYARRRAALSTGLERIGADVALVWSPASVCYFTGNDIAGSNALLIWSGGLTEVVAEEYDAVNFARLADPGLQIRDYPYTAERWSAVAGCLRAGAGTGRVAVEFANLPAVAWQRLTGGLDGVPIVPLDEELRRCRLVKSEAELALIRRSAALVGRALEAARALLAERTTEAELTAALYRELILGGSAHLASQPYVKSGPRALCTHARWSDRTILPDEHVLIELAGCSGRYHAALMRTRLAARRSSGYRRAVPAVVAGRDSYLEHTRPGVTADELHARYLEALRDHGVESWNRHASGYSLGIAFPPTWGEVELLTVSPGADLELRPGMVLHLISGLTEPAQGVPHVGLSECLLVTEGGYQRLVEVPDFL